MLKEEARRYFGNDAAIAKALNISPAAVCRWGDKVPQLRAYQIAEIMGRHEAEKSKSYESSID